MGFLPYTQNTLQNGEVEAFKNHMSGTESQAFRRKKKNPLNILAFISSRWLTYYAPGLLGSYK
jgi:hypothetical protein